MIALGHAKEGIPPAEATYQPHDLAAKVAALQMMVFAVVRGPG
ncbi:hypothetical protein WCLP8_570007 [uncultured Gammaproteobacteria bacterium]